MTLSCSANLDGIYQPRSLILGKGNQLEIYQHGVDVDGNKKLGLRANFPLSGSLVGLAPVTVVDDNVTDKVATSLQTIDLLLLVFSPAKVLYFPEHSL